MCLLMFPILYRVVTYDREEMAKRGRKGGRRTNQLHDPHKRMAKARAGFLAKLERLADPDGCLPPEERARRVEELRHAHAVRCGRASAGTGRTEGVN